jgi:ArsR family transcriptional regulator
MPLPTDSFIETPTKTRITVGLAPVQNALHSLLLLTETERLSGLGDWVVDTANRLSPEERKEHYYVMIGFSPAIMTVMNWSSFPVYINHLAAMDPEDMQDKLLKSYFHKPIKEDASIEFTMETAISSEDNYIAFLKQRYDHQKIDEQLERWAYRYIIDPPEMKQKIVTHLQKYWDDYLQAEWERVQPTLQKAVDAFRDVDFGQMDNFEAAKYVLGQAVMDEQLESKCNQAKGMFFAPSLHVGPYLGKFFIDDSQGIIFGARLPDDASNYAPELSQADIYVRLSALADETRLQILKHIALEGESCSTEIINALELSQSAASRHLKQLTATGYLTARRKDGAKCFRLDKERIGSTLDTIKTFLSI